MTRAIAIGLSLLLAWTGAAAAEPSHYLVTDSGGASEILSAPHVGGRVCKPASGTPVRLLREARHGPHRYAQVLVLDGECAGAEGFAPWGHLSREPPAKPGGG